MTAAQCQAVATSWENYYLDTVTMTPGEQRPEDLSRRGLDSMEQNSQEASVVAVACDVRTRIVWKEIFKSYPAAVKAGHSPDTIQALLNATRSLLHASCPDLTSVSRPQRCSPRPARVQRHSRLPLVLPGAPQYPPSPAPLPAHAPPFPLPSAASASRS